ncbi:hypothetical protein ACTHAM_001422 [Cellulomonas soli]|uniref:hypothetical protein n=1 Tax=Cellulomonas soli TaxID=931535 RepID=UPI003F84E25E
MSRDFGQELRDLAAQAATAAHPVDVDRTRARLHRRRTQTLVTRSVGGLAAVGALVTGAVLLGARTTTDQLPVAPVTTPAPTSTSTPGATLCGTTFALPERDALDTEIQGAVVVGTLHADTASFETGTGVRDTLLVDVGTTADVPTGPSDGLDPSGVTTMLVAPDGTVAFWTDPARQLQVTATDGSGGLAPDGLYAAVDCRTGSPLTGTYRAYATTATDGTDGETVELAPVSLEPGSGTLAGQWPDRVPACGKPAPADLLTGRTDADLDVTLDPSVDLGEVPGGLHVGATLTATGTGRLIGRVPQALHALLVDSDGIVVSQLYDPTRQEYDSGTTFDVGPGESFRGEIYQWFASCTTASGGGEVPAGTYDLYVYTVMLASAGPDLSPGPALAVGGPFTVTLE